ncbi:MAG: [FeFe] hydrogenase, group A [Verrucomicrobiota bacterium]|jgi:NADH-quinone oxidoreductase subunit G|nr:[FeFe] hydrogenase, group A [Verrucomicrobiota bacterium]
MKMLNLKINDIPVQVPEGTNILNAAKMAQVKIPSLCYHPDLPAWAACGICVVKIKGSSKMIRACSAAAAEGMDVITHDPELYSIRRTVLELILSTHPDDCLQCPRNGSCELQRLAQEFGIREAPYGKRLRNLPVEESTTSIVLNPEKCILCGRCAAVCQQMQGVWALEFLSRGENTRIAPAADVTLDESPCIKCGQCSAHCPVGAIYEKDETGKVIEALRDPNKICVVQIAPAVRVALGEAFGLEPGALTTGQIYAALRRLGFQRVFDTNYSADVTIMEEGTEFISRFTKGGTLPLITSCCPAWTDWMEKYAPDFVENFSTAKSPQQMLSALAKSYYAEKEGLKPKQIFMVSIMPCTAKKFEISRSDDMCATGKQDTDVVLTTRELGRMFLSAGIDFTHLKDETADELLGAYSGAGTIFGVTGGVMEAALRTAYCLLTGEAQPPSIEFACVRGMEGVKEAEVDIKGTRVRIAVAHQMGNVEQVLNAIREDRAAGRKPRYDFIEVMACRGGCIGGGGQPTGANDDVRAKRTAGLYTDDERSAIRMSHLNPQVQALYRDYLGQPNSDRAHHLLHTKYTKRKLYKC